MGNWIAFFSGLFLLTNIGRIFAYIPQIRAALACKNGAKSISRFTWSYFAVSHATVSIYGFFVLGDAAMGAIFLGNCAACCTLVGIVTAKKKPGHFLFRSTQTDTHASLTFECRAKTFSKSLIAANDGAASHSYIAHSE